MMRALSVVLLLAGCDEVGLDTLGADLVGPVLEVEPAGDIAFGGTAFDGGSTAKTLELMSTGDESLLVLDVYFDEETPLAFDFADEVALPAMVPPGKSLPVDLLFAPDAIGSYNGWVLSLIHI